MSHTELLNYPETACRWQHPHDSKALVFIHIYSIYILCLWICLLSQCFVSCLQSPTHLSAGPSVCYCSVLTDPSASWSGCPSEEVNGDWPHARSQLRVLCRTFYCTKPFANISDCYAMTWKSSCCGFCLVTFMLKSAVMWLVRKI